MKPVGIKQQEALWHRPPPFDLTDVDIEQPKQLMHARRSHG